MDVSCQSNSFSASASRQHRWQWCSSHISGPCVMDHKPPRWKEAQKTGTDDADLPDGLSNQQKGRSRKSLTHAYGKE